MNGFIMADELSIFDLTEADGRAAVIAWGKTVTTGVSWKSQAYQLSVSHTHTHTHSCIYAVIESFCYCGAQGNVFLFLSVARIPFLLCLKQRMWLFFSFAQIFFQVETEREREKESGNEEGREQSKRWQNRGVAVTHTHTKCCYGHSACHKHVSRGWAFPRQFSQNYAVGKIEHWFWCWRIRRFSKTHH